MGADSVAVQAAPMARRVGEVVATARGAPMMVRLSVPMARHRELPKTTSPAPTKQP
jgi:hypothetical protein